LSTFASVSLVFFVVVSFSIISFVVFLVSRYDGLIRTGRMKWNNSRISF